MKKIVKIPLFALLLAATVLAFKIPPPPGEHYCKNNSTLNTGLCGIATDGTASCFALQHQSTIKDCYDVVNTATP